MKKIVLYSTLCVIAVSLVLLSCSEELGYMADTSHQGETCELVRSAKQILQSRGGEISLPANSSRKTSLSRSSLTYLSDLEPLWDESFTHNQDDENYFSGCDGFEINGISQNRMRLLEGL